MKPLNPVSQLQQNCDDNSSVLQHGTVATVVDYHYPYYVLEPCYGVTTQAH